MVLVLHIFVVVYIIAPFLQVKSFYVVLQDNTALSENQQKKMNFKNNFLYPIVIKISMKFTKRDFHKY